MATGNSTLASTATQAAVKQKKERAYLDTPILISPKTHVPAAFHIVDQRWVTDVEGSPLNRWTDDKGAAGVKAVPLRSIYETWDTDALFMCFHPIGCPPARVSKEAIYSGEIPVEMRFVGIDYDRDGKSWAGVDFIGFCQRHLSGPMARRFAWWQTRGGLRGLSILDEPEILDSADSLLEYEARLRAHRMLLQAESGLELDAAVCDDATRLQRIAHGVRDGTRQTLGWFQHEVGVTTLRGLTPVYKPGESPEERERAEAARVERLARVRRNVSQYPVDRSGRADRYMLALPPAIEGQGGHVASRSALWRMILGFDLDETEAVELAHAYNAAKCVPPFDAKIIERIARDAVRKAQNHTGRGDMLDSDWEARPRFPEQTPEEAADQTVLAQEILSECREVRESEVPRSVERTEPEASGAPEVCLPHLLDPGDDYDRPGPGDGSPLPDPGDGGMEEHGEEPPAATPCDQPPEGVCSLDSLLYRGVENPRCIDLDPGWDLVGPSAREAKTTLRGSHNISLHKMADGILACQAAIDNPETHHLESVFGTGRWRCKHSKYCPLCGWVQAHELGDSVRRTLLENNAGDAEKKCAAVWVFEFEANTLGGARDKAQAWASSRLAARVAGRDVCLLRIFSRRYSVPSGIDSEKARQRLLVFCLRDRAIDDVAEHLRDDIESGRVNCLGAARGTAEWARRLTIDNMHVPDWFSDPAAAGEPMVEYFNAEAGTPQFRKGNGLSAIWKNATDPAPEGEAARGHFKSVVYARDVAHLARRDKETAVAIVKTKIHEFVRWNAGGQPHAPVVRYQHDGLWVEWVNKSRDEQAEEKPPTAPRELSDWRAWDMLLEMQQLLQGDPEESRMAIKSLFESIELRDESHHQRNMTTWIPGWLRTEMRADRKLWDASEQAVADRIRREEMLGSYAQHIIAFDEGRAAG